MNHAFRRVPLWALALSAAALLNACKSAEVIPRLPGLEPYRITIQQGNYISQEMVAQLKLGMTRDQVRFVLGTPLLMDVFHADRWDYVYYRQVPGDKREQRNLSVVFEKDKLARVIGDLVPPEGVAPQPTGFVPQTKPAAPAKAAPELAKPAPAAAPDVARPTPDAAKPLAEEPKPPGLAEPNAPSAPAEQAEPVETKQNWSSASDLPEPAPAANDTAQKPAAEEQKPAADAQEPGFFGRLLQKIGL